MQARENTDEEIAGIIRLNGIEEEKDISRIINNSDGDLRRVKRDVHKHLISKKKKETKDQLTLEDQNTPPGSESHPPQGGNAPQERKEVIA